MARRSSDICYYEVISQRQCTYFDLDLKIRDCSFIPPKLEKDKFSLVLQFLDLLRWGYRKNLDMSLDLGTVIVGNGCGKENFLFM